MIGPKILAPGPIYTLSPMVGVPSFPCDGAFPILVHTCILQFFPIFALPDTTIVPTCTIVSPGPNTLIGILQLYLLHILLYLMIKILFISSFIGPLLQLQ